MYSIYMLRLILLVANLSTAAGLMAEPPLRWWKGNLHTHSLWSDGDDYPEMIVDWYQRHGYHFLALSDHNVLSDHERWIVVAASKGGDAAFAKYLGRFGEPWVEQRESGLGKQVRLKMLSEFRVPFEQAGKFLLIQSEEITGQFMKAPIHLNATNVQEAIAPPFGRTVTDVMQKMINSVVEQRQRTGVPMIPHINHPNFGWAVTAEELIPLENEQFFEVYNGHPAVHNEGDKSHAGLDRVWDIVLTERLARLGKGAFFGLATDDAHHYHGDPTKQSRTGRGWIVVRAANLTAEDLIAAMEAGDFYASSGVVL
ncbi:MAG: hypothetical protein ABIZ36_12335, partial [Gemmatimonadaceae bacterium]